MFPLTYMCFAGPSSVLVVVNWPLQLPNPWETLAVVSGHLRRIAALLLLSPIIPLCLQIVTTTHPANQCFKQLQRPSAPTEQQGTNQAAIVFPTAREALYQT